MVKKRFTGTSGKWTPGHHSSKQPHQIWYRDIMSSWKFSWPLAQILHTNISSILYPMTVLWDTMHTFPNNPRHQKTPTVIPIQLQDTRKCRVHEVTMWPRDELSRWFWSFWSVHRWNSLGSMLLLRTIVIWKGSGLCCWIIYRSGWL